MLNRATVVMCGSQSNEIIYNFKPLGNVDLSVSFGCN